MSHIAGCWTRSRQRAKEIKARGYITREYLGASKAIEDSIEHSKMHRKAASRAADAYIDARKNATSATRLLEDKLQASLHAYEKIDSDASKQMDQIGG